MAYKTVIFHRKLFRFFLLGLTVLSFIFLLLYTSNVLEVGFQLSPTPVTAGVGDTGIHEGTHALPSEYTSIPEQSPFCTRLFGTAYLKSMRDWAAEYCAPESSSGLTCFHTQTSGSRIDSFCLARGASFNSTRQKFTLDCQLQAPSIPNAPVETPEYRHFTNYWYNTGPNVVFDKVLDLENTSHLTGHPGHLGHSNFTILVNREGAANPWHSLMEIFSMTMAIDVLRMSHHPQSSRPFFTAADIDRTQILVLDDSENGPFFDLWSLFARKPVQRLKDLKLDSPIGLQNLIIPAAGGSNPLWQGDWEPHSCRDSPLLRTFSNRVLDFYGLQGQTPGGADLVVTFINRTSSRKLDHSDEYFHEVEATFPHVKFRSVDFATIPFKQQLEIVRGTDVLVGVHGAGLTHGIFLSPGSAIVEILPSGLNHKGFRNVASLLGHSYFSSHASRTNGNDWHHEDVFLEKEKFMDLMNVAIKSMYNKGERNYDVN
ncbi:hypothetical protein BDV28DRAFT_164342 [Aspergillus coremiiformis]|uniref:EGF domain-specific O-linked N-acetylglucosamine transferase n=1 Tax=Aspergillus coremiiformis TaxID=138285 RepID=A0A5N6YSN8_9EURO|nr:hypothetical protein BDV28DRAFT_164342 [Aspergillus coremiiformis]